jgi:signal transduction histidine kinase
MKYPTAIITSLGFGWTMISQPSALWAQVESAGPTFAVASYPIAYAISALALAFALWTLLHLRRSKSHCRDIETVNQYLSNVIEHGTVAFMTVHAGGTCYCSDRLKQWLELPNTVNSLSELMIISKDSGVGEKENNRFYKGLERLIKKHKPFRTQLNVTTTNRTYLVTGSPVSMDGQSSPPGQNESAYAIVWFCDISHLALGSQTVSERLASSDAQKRILADVLDAAPFPIWIRNKNLDLEWVNKPYSEAVDQPKPKAVIKAQTELVGESLSSPLRKIAENALTEKEGQKRTHHVVIGGERKAVEIYEIPLEKAGSATIGYAVDVSREEALNQQLESHRKSHAETLDRMTVPVTIFGPDQSLQFCNHAFATLWHLSDEWLQTKPQHAELLERLREDHRLPEQPDFPAWKRQLLSHYTELLSSAEDTWHLPDGKTLRVVTQPHPLGGLLVLYEDVTDRLALERSYNTLIAVQRETLDNLHEAVAVIGSDGRIKLHNSNFVKIWQLKESDLEKEPHIGEILDKCRRLFAANPADWPDIRAEILGYTISRSPRSGSWSLTNAAMLDFSVVPLPDGAALLTIIDETAKARVAAALRERNEALEAADKLKSEFVASMSYELRTPLNSIIGFAQILDEGYFGDLNSRQTEYVKGLLTSSAKLRDLIDDVLDMAVIEAGKMAMDIDKFAVSGLVEKVLGMVNERARNKRIELKLDLAASLETIEADSRRISQALYNMLIDSIDFAKVGDTIILSGEGSQSHIELKIEIIVKSGQQQMPHGSDQYSGSTGRLRSGSGLGLSLVRSFIGLHDGTIEITESGPHARTILCSLPRQVPAAKAGQGPGDTNESEL